MQSSKEKSLDTLYANNRDELVELAFEYLISDDQDKKKEVRTNITASNWFDGYGILTLAGKLFSDSRAGWGRAKRNAITTWYINRPLVVVKAQIQSQPSEGDISHKDIISFLHITSLCTEQDRYQYFADMVGEKATFGQASSEPITKKKKTGFWSFISDLFGG